MVVADPFNPTYPKRYSGSAVVAHVDRVELAALDDLLDQVGAKAVAQVAVIRHRQHQQVSLFAGRERTDPVGAADGVGGIDGGSGDGLGRGQFQVAAGQGDHELHGLVPGCAGVAVRCQGQHAVGIQDLLGGGVILLRQAKGRAGQRDGHRIRATQGGNIGVRGAHQVVSRSGSQLHGQGGAAQVVKFVGVDLEREAQAAGGLQDLAGLSQVESLVLAEDIHKGRVFALGGVGLPPLLQDGQHGAGHQVGIALRVILVLGRDGMRAQESDGQIDGSFGIQGQQGFEQTQLGGGLQTVACLGFGGGGAGREHAQQAGARLGHERLDRGAAGGMHGGDDAAARGQDVEVVLALQAHLKLGRAVTGPDDVRVRVDKTGHDHAAGGVQGRLVGVGVAQFVGVPGGDDLLVPDEHGAVGDDAQLAEVTAALGFCG